MLQSIGQDQDHAIGKHQFSNTDLLTCQGIDHCHSDHREQVGHVLDADLFRSIPQNAEYGKKTERETDAQLHAVQENTQEEDQYVEQEISEQIILFAMDRIVDQPDQDEPVSYTHLTLPTSDLV